ncbi:MAG: glycosyl hydrolase 108 family protein [Desulfatiglandales bacterium]
MANFTKNIQSILKKEGVQFDFERNPILGKTGYVNHPKDPGGETNFGITKKAAVEHGYKDSMRDIPYPIVLQIYKTKYWDKIGGDDILDEEIAHELMDIGINCGIARVNPFFQRTLNVFNKGGTLYPDLKVDGFVGPVTIEVLKKALAVKPWYRLVILRALDSLQGVHYIDITEKNPRLEVFIPGWFLQRIGVDD